MVPQNPKNSLTLRRLEMTELLFPLFTRQHFPQTLQNAIPHLRRQILKGSGVNHVGTTITEEALIKTTPFPPPSGPARRLVQGPTPKANS